MQIVVNGEPKSFPGQTLLTDYLSELGLQDKKAIAVALNGEVVAREHYESIELGDGDILEIVKAIGGG